MKKLIGHGVVSWDGPERRSKRYGAIVLGSETYFREEACPSANMNMAAFTELLGKRVRLTAVVQASRPSGHVGDQFLRIEPSEPSIGQTFVLGVGILMTEVIVWSDTPAIVLQPGDGRELFWYDPRQLYQLHDQTIDLFAEETDEEFSAAPNVTIYEEDGVLANHDGTFQVAGRQPSRIGAKIERIGGGTFIIGSAWEKGERIPVVEYEETE